jgi:Fungal specific transcription factor domain/Fungal Zn(2)-Cys(6) binuclear cluster domain
MAHEDKKVQDRSLAPLGVCNRCKARKKKCDKVLPSCGRCTRLSISCVYSVNSGETVSTAAIITRHPDIFDNTTKNLQRDDYNVKDALLPLFISKDTFVSAATSLQPHNSIMNGPYLNFDEQYTKQVQEIISTNGDNFEASLFHYFGLIHDWFPILNKAQMREGLVQLESTPRAEFSDLVLCTYLVTQLSGQESGNIEHIRRLYHTTKGLHYLLLSTGRVSMEVVQSGLLIALYENTQGLHDASYSSVGACARMGYTLGFDRTLSPDTDMLSRLPAVVEHERRVWWAIVILERYNIDHLSLLELMVNY